MGPDPTGTTATTVLVTVSITETEPKVKEPSVTYTRVPPGVMATPVVKVNSDGCDHGIAGGVNYRDGVGEGNSPHRRESHPGVAYLGNGFNGDGGNHRVLLAASITETELEKEFAT